MRSIVGRFREPSRVFRFGSQARGCRYFIGSADLMGRNLDRRVEVVAPIESPELRERLEEILATNLADDTLAWELGPEGGWFRPPRRSGIETHPVLLEGARLRANGSAGPAESLSRGSDPLPR